MASTNVRSFTVSPRKADLVECFPEARFVLEVSHHEHAVFLVEVGQNADVVGRISLCAQRNTQLQPDTQSM